MPADAVPDVAGLSSTDGRGQMRNPHHERRWLILAVLGVAQLMVVLDVTIVNIALPSAQKALHFSDENRQWIITAYALAFGSLLLLGGKISDLFGRKWTFVTGLAGFAVVSALGGLAQSFGMLVGARALQGVFAALLAPAALSLLSTTFTDREERNKAFGIFSAIAGSGSAIGLLLGGALTEYLSWRWCLYVNLAFAGAAIVGALVLLHNQAQQDKPRIDVPGTITASAGLMALVYGFSRSESHGWGSALVLGLMAAAAVLLAAFVTIQRRVAHPLLPLHVVQDRRRGGAYIAIGLSGSAIFSVFLFLTYFLQQTLGYSPIETGLAFLPMTAAIMITATTSQTKILPRIGPRPLIVTGMALGCTGMLILTRLEVDSSYAGHVLPALIVTGVGFGCIFASALSSATRGVAASDSGVASAMVNTSQQLGGSVGTALLTTFFASAVTDYLTTNGRTPEAIRAAAVHGYTTAFWWSAGIFALGAVVSALVLPAGVPDRALSR